MRRRIRVWTLKAGLAGVTLAICVLAVEVAARTFDFDVTGGLFNRVPITYRKPHVPTGEAFFRRAGPAVWRGRARATFLRMTGQERDYYADEPVITVRYDAQGFRNEPPLDAWDVVVVGDSFTELGYLAYEDLFTTRAAVLLGVRVKNLGVGYTGTLTHTHYVREYGCHPAARHVVLAFFEGNDLWDTLRETEDVRATRAGRPRPVVSTIVTPLTAAVGLLGGLWGERQGVNPNAMFVRGTEEIPVTVTVLDAPLNEAAWLESAKLAVRDALAAYVQVAKECGMVPWLLLMPTKLRVIHDHVRFLDSADEAIRQWTPSDLPQFIKRLSEENGIRYLDPTPELTALADQGVLPYSHVFDTHFSKEGSHAVGDVLARGLAETIARKSKEGKDTRPRAAAR
jgi:hypothetical protein